jgi:Flp pilus assembly pilin Flp
MPAHPQAGAAAVVSTITEESHMQELLLRPLVRAQIAITELKEREDGQTTTEYAILLGFLAIAIIIALFFLRGVLRSLFSAAASSVSGAPNG